LRKNLIATGAVVGALLLGSAGAALVLPSMAVAADPSASPAATASPLASGVPWADHRSGGRCDTTEAVSDASVAAKAIGITEAELNTALAGGRTIAEVAKANNVDVQKVIDALVQDQKDEVAAAVKAGTITQAQAGQKLANVTAFVTAQVNGTGIGRGGRAGPGGRGGHGPMGDPGAHNGTPDASPSAGTGTSG
jgi:hypothetical protein